MVDRIAEHRTVLLAARRSSQAAGRRSWATTVRLSGLRRGFHRLMGHAAGGGAGCACLSPRWWPSVRKRCGRSPHRRFDGCHRRRHDRCRRLHRYRPPSPRPSPPLSSSRSRRPGTAERFDRRRPPSLHDRWAPPGMRHVGPVDLQRVGVADVRRLVRSGSARRSWLNSRLSWLFMRCGPSIHSVVAAMRAGNSRISML